MIRSKSYYIPAWPALAPKLLFPGRNSRSLPFPFSAPRRTYFFRASNAIYRLFRALNLRAGEVVLVPDYHSWNEVMAMRAAGAGIRYYPIRQNLMPDLDELRILCRGDVRALYVIHYLGWPQPIQEMASLAREKGLLLIEDCALSLLTKVKGAPLGSFGDYSVFCLYKTLPVPNGGLLVQNRNALPELSDFQFEPCGLISGAGRASELILEWLRGHANGIGKSLLEAKRLTGSLLRYASLGSAPVGNIGFDISHVNLGISPTALQLIERFDYSQISSRRIENFLLMQRRLEGKVPLLEIPLDNGVVPLFFPLLVPDKHLAAEELSKRGVCAVEFWNYGDPQAWSERFGDAQFLRDHLLELPIYQDVTAEHVDYMAEQILRLGLHF